MIENIKTSANIWKNLTPSELVEKTLLIGEGKLTNTGALSIETGEFTGRSPKDRYIVSDEITNDRVWWGDVNIKLTPQQSSKLEQDILNYLSDKDIYTRDSYVCSDDENRLNLRVITEKPWSNMFANNMFLRPNKDERENFTPEWNILCAPGFKANPEVHGTRQHNFAIINFSEKKILIGGTGYTGEIKKGVFSVLNFILPAFKNVLSMHCSANIGKEGDTAIFFGLSGTGKTTLSSDPNRKLIGDDEHGWSDRGVFNFEGGCYAKTINLSKTGEPQIWDAIKFGSILENVILNDDNTVDYTDNKITENTRVSYPLNHIENCVNDPISNSPKNIFFLTADAFGVLPPISKLTKEQAMYHFMSGYTAKVAGTEMGITEPTTTFSACFGKAFLPLHPAKYAELLGNKLEDDINVWLINTGWTGGSYGTGKRINLNWTRNMITSALNGNLNNINWETLPIFGLKYPTECEGVPSNILNPKDTWTDKELYDQTATKLATEFINNFKQFEDQTSNEITQSGPKI